MTAFFFIGGVCVVPINDIRGLEGMSYTKNEKALRCRLAAAYRLADLHGWTQGINNHISLRISQVSCLSLCSYADSAT